MIFFAHRGDSTNYPENTVAAFRSSLRKKFRALELDLITIADGNVVIFHDDNLLRMTGNPATARDLTTEEFLNLFPDLTTLDEFTDLFSRADIIVNFEIKDSPLTFLKAAERMKKFRHPVISSFLPEAAEAALKEGFESAYLFHDEAGFLRNINRLKTGRLHLHKSVVLEGGATAELLRNYEVYCYTVNDPSELRLLSDREYVKGIFTDSLLPDQMIRSGTV